MENSRVDWVHRDLVFSGIADESFGIGEGNVGWGRPVALVVGDDLYTIILPHTDATRWTGEWVGGDLGQR